LKQYETSIKHETNQNERERAERKVSSGRERNSIYSDPSMEREKYCGSFFVFPIIKINKMRERVRGRTEEHPRIERFILEQF
jgi:hypothetical protein